MTRQLSAAADQIEARRRVNQVRLIGHLRQQGRIRDDLTDDEATDILWALTSYDLYRSLVPQRNRPAGRYQSWLAQTLVGSLSTELSGQRQDEHVEHG